jgi:hypothetical protein
MAIPQLATTNQGHNTTALSEGTFGKSRAPHSALSLLLPLNVAGLRATLPYYPKTRPGWDPRDGLCRTYVDGAIGSTAQIDSTPQRIREFPQTRRNRQRSGETGDRFGRIAETRLNAAIQQLRSTGGRFEAQIDSEEGLAAVSTKR